MKTISNWVVTVAAVGAVALGMVVGMRPERAEAQQAAGPFTAANTLPLPAIEQVGLSNDAVQFLPGGYSMVFTNGAGGSGTNTSSTGLNLAATVNTSTYTLQRGKDLGLLLPYTASNPSGQTGTNTVVWGFDYQVGNLWTTSLPLMLTNNAGVTNGTGAAALIGGTNIYNPFFLLLATNFVGVNAIRCDYVQVGGTNQIKLLPGQVDYTH